MGHYRSNVRNLEFNLFEVLGVAFCRGKLAAASFFAKTILPAISATRTVVENVDIDLMDVADDAF